jgi:hypothetical protein
MLCLSAFAAPVGCSGADDSQGAGLGSGGAQQTTTGGGATGGSGGGTAANGGAGTGATGAGGTGAAPGALLLFDDFEYVVEREAGNVADFQAAGWSGAKAINLTGGYNGYLYTVDAVDGFVGGFPGQASSRVLAVESRAETLGSQADFYLQYGDPEDPASADALPGNVWFQFWIYSNSTAAEPSQLGGGKFIYPCNAAYPCNTGKWIFEMGANTYLPHWLTPSGDPTDGDVYVRSSDNQVGVVDYLPAEDYNQWKLGQTNVDEHITANRWTLVKIHYDTSGPNGSFETWMRAPGGQWTKVCDWVAGVTADFVWTLSSEERGGHRAFRMPTTLGGNEVRYDVWLYLDDFAIATDEGALPIYP